MQGPGGRPPNCRQGGAAGELCHPSVMPHSPRLCCPYSLHDTWRAPEVVCPIVPHNVPDTHSPVTAACGNVFEVRGLVCPKPRARQPARPPAGPYLWPAVWRWDRRPWWPQGLCVSLSTGGRHCPLARPNEPVAVPDWLSLAPRGGCSLWVLLAPRGGCRGPILIGSKFDWEILEPTSHPCPRYLIIRAEIKGSNVLLVLLGEEWAHRMLGE